MSLKQLIFCTAVLIASCVMVVIRDNGAWAWMLVLILFVL